MTDKIITTSERLILRMPTIADAREIGNAQSAIKDAYEMTRKL